MTRNHLIYIFIILALGLPLYFGVAINPGSLKNTETAFEVVEKATSEKGKYAMLALDFGPNAKAENLNQAAVYLEHVLRKRMPVILFTLNVQGEAYLKSLPEEIAKRLNAESTTENIFSSGSSEKWEYGKDWINVGLQVGNFLQSVGKTEDLANYFNKDTTGTPVKNYPNFQNLKTLNDVAVIGEMTATLIIPAYIQFFRRENYAPKIIHGPTSILIPQAYNYLDSKQIAGLLEGVPSAAIYAQLIEDKFAKKKDEVIEAKPHPAKVMNTALGIAQLLILFFVLIGNLMDFRR